jgi:hypothetical protein
MNDFVRGMGEEYIHALIAQQLTGALCQEMAGTCDGPRNALLFRLLPR